MSHSQGAGSDKNFAGSIPRLYQQYLVPMIFLPYAEDLAKRVAARSPKSVLEVAAGTGVVTRKLAETLPEDVAITATDLNQPMIDEASSIGTKQPVIWRQADAMSLPFPDRSFDVVVCQFGAMFFPEKPRAFAEARRVLRPGGAFIFNVWDRLTDNEVAQLISDAAASVFPDDPPRFLERTPYGYNDPAVIRADLAAGGFTAPAELVTLTTRARAASAHEAAIGLCEGSPLRNEIEARDPSRLEAVTRAAAKAIERRFGPGAVDSKQQAIVVIQPV